ncbi:protein of unknown function DUF659 [Dillenia turbinata]|uniref:DUF659 domain-containing protein n=1 Tax=Dillenia turbinata TaxID=194707 RepID=A0AAN8VWE6_9MAGN
MDYSQPTIQTCRQSKKRWHDADIALALWFYDTCISINTTNSPYFVQAMTKVASMGLTDNTSLYEAAGTLIAKKHPTISWSLYAVHGLNLILKDIREMNLMNSLTSLASRLKLDLGTTFIPLKSFHDQKEYLEILVTSSNFKSELKQDKGKKNNRFIIVKIISPILRLLRICDSNEKPSLGYAYEGMSRIMRLT